jgi:hypothetical protein
MNTELSDVDQSRVDAVLSRGTYALDRKPFRPLLLLAVVVAVLTGLSLLSFAIARWHGVV